MLEPLSKPIWQDNLCSLLIKHKCLGNISAKIHKLDGKNSNYVTLITDTAGNCIGFNSFSINTDSKFLEGFDMNTYYKYRNKNYGIGRLMRLISIMLMLKNKLNSIKIYSKHTAVYFHAKHKFEPAITRFEDRDWVLQSIAEDSSPEMETFSQKAKNYIKNLTKLRRVDMLQSTLQFTSSLADEYIKAVLNLGNNQYKEHPFKYGFDMLLTKNKILKNKDFFDNLFKQTGIDYKI